jgi:hypothetical protein
MHDFGNDVRYIEEELNNHNKYLEKGSERICTFLS